MKVYVCYTLNWDGIEDITLVTDSFSSAEEYVNDTSYKGVRECREMIINEVSEVRQ